MKIKSDFVLREAFEKYMVLPLGANNTHLTSMLNLNETGAMLWRLLEKGCDSEALVQALLAEYDVSPEQAREDVAEYIEKLRKAGCIDDEEDNAL